MHLPNLELRFDGRRPLIMGILNVTPDSFSDGGRYFDADTAIRGAVRMVHDGADIIDVGPESTRPGASPVEADEQMRRAVPVVEALRKLHPQVAISVDTRLSSVARAAIQAGADIINDISALRDDPHLGELAAARHVALVLMHMQGRPADMQRHPTYDDVVHDVAEFLRQRVAVAVSAGVSAGRVIVDPGIGFGKTAAHNLTIMRRLDEIVALGWPVLVGASRKSFIGEVTGEGEPHRRLAGSLACVARAVDAGVRIVRVHDVAETRQFLDVLQAAGR